MTDGKFSKLNTLDVYGNSALHLAAQSGQKEVAVYLLQKGVDSGVKNKQGKFENYSFLHLNSYYTSSKIQISHWGSNHIRFMKKMSLRNVFHENFPKKFQ